MKSCPNCGLQSSDEDRFCRACGRPFSAVVGAIPGPSSLDQVSLPFEEADYVAIREFWSFGLLSTVAFGVGLTSFLPLGLHFPATQLAQLVVIALDLAGAYYLRLGFRALSKADQPRFGSQVTFTTVYAIGVAILIGFYEVYLFVVSPFFYTPISPGLFSSSGLALFIAVILAFTASAIVTLAGLIGGVILGLWRVGSRYGRTWLKAASIMSVIPVVNVFAGIVFIFVFRNLKHASSRPSPASVYSSTAIPSHTVRNVLIVVASVLLVFTVLGAAFYVILSPSIPGPHLIVHSAPAPTGIADYGLTSYSGKSLTYRVSASQVTAQATIDSINASNPSVEPASNSHLVSLQLNLCLLVNTTKGTQVYWVQNIAFLYTQTIHGVAPYSQHLSFNNQIDNMSASLNSLSNSTISGTTGWVFPRPYPHYASGSPNGNYASLPLDFRFFTSEVVGPAGVWIVMGYQISNGTRDSPTSQLTYDTVHLKIANVTGAAFVVDGRVLNPRGTYYDAELVFGGPPGGYSTFFTSMHSTLTLTYTLTNGSVARPNSVWEFGSDTAEGASNLRTDLVNGELVVMVGNLDLYQNWKLG
ncbi:MAG TPA: thermopsin family protease [Nitrososphaerales archaeon]|nr:thermopsin family protease [Nitrososphaerales archaeon]